MSELDVIVIHVRAGLDPGMAQAREGTIRA
jgi:hypothetical protein